MKHLIFLLAVTLCNLNWLNDTAAQMDNQQLLTIIEREAEDVGGEIGAWHLSLDDHVLFITTDEENNRIRILTPIVEERDIDAEKMHKMLEANFHSALDAKYSIYKGFVISIFTHPLRELNEAQLIDAMHQVIRLSETFGTTYSSTDILLDGQADDDEPDDRVKPATKKKS
ncbi:MAG: hypothetical protein R2824_11310 [Saprospiraceae bacterium]|nr:hypothetical protein [Lewinella sp.]